MLVVAGCSRYDSADLVSGRRVSGPGSPTDSVTQVASISIVASSTIFSAGDTTTLVATPRDSLENALPARRAQWTSTDSTIVRVTATGLATAVAPGTTTLRVRAGDHSERLVLTVSRPALAIRAELSDNIQKLVDNAPEGSTFLIVAGVHHQNTIIPRNGMSFVGEAGAVLDGDGITAFAFRADSGHNVTLRHLVIRGYKPPVQDGAVHAEGRGGWVIDSCDIGLNATGGIRLGNHTRVLNSHIHDNGQIGVLGGGDDIHIEGNEIDHNNPQSAYDMYWEAGGTKFARTRDLVVRRNFVHHNNGPGLWTDIDNVRTLYENNRVEGNAEAGILHEISYSAVIRNNELRHNGSKAVPRSGITGAGILVSASSDVEVYGNTVEDNHNGITAIQASRDRGRFGAHILRDLDVHDNTIAMHEGVTGIRTRGVAKYLDDVTYTTFGNRFHGNNYRLGPNPRPFQWKNENRTEDEWKAYGQDTGGRFVRSPE